MGLECRGGRIPPISIKFLQLAFNKGSTSPIAHHPAELLGRKVIKMWEKWTWEGVAREKGLK